MRTRSPETWAVMRDLIVLTIVDPSYLACLHTAHLPVCPVYCFSKSYTFWQKNMTGIGIVISKMQVSTM